MTHETMNFDVIIVGGGPSGLSAAIRLKQLAKAHQREISVCVLEKGSRIGAHILSGAVLEPHVLKSLLPETWRKAPLNTPVTHDAFYYLSAKHAIKLPTPSPMKNQGNYILSLGELCQFLATEAEQLGCEIYPGFTAAKILYDQEKRVIGVATGDMGIDKYGHETEKYQPGMHLLAKQTLFAEGCRGQLSQQLMHHFNLRLNCQPQTYALGIKEIWQISPDKHQLGHVMHSVGWSLDHKTYGGSFIYHLTDNRIAIGFVVGLDYRNLWLNPFQEFQRFKTHPLVHPLLLNGERLAYGGRALNEGGWQSMPKLSFPGGILIGDCAGFLNVPKIKGIHTAMQSAIIGAETCYNLLRADASPLTENVNYAKQIQSSWIAKELYIVRNIRPGFRFVLLPGLALAAWETYVTRGKSPWTLPNHADHESLKNISRAKLIDYHKSDGTVTYDILSSVYLSNTFHDENQPCHLHLRDKSLAISVNYSLYGSPETRYCPAGVYEIILKDNAPKLQINGQNCIHCKTCDIKDPTQNIVWTVPEGGGGPDYINM